MAVPAAWAVWEGDLGGRLRLCPGEAAPEKLFTAGGAAAAVLAVLAGMSPEGTVTEEGALGGLPPNLPEEEASPAKFLKGLLLALPQLARDADISKAQWGRGEVSGRTSP